MRSVTTTMKIDIEGYAIMTRVTGSGMSIPRSTRWTTKTQATAASARAARRPSSTTADCRSLSLMPRRAKPSSPAASSAYPESTTTSGRIERLAVRSPMACS